MKKSESADILDSQILSGPRPNSISLLALKYQNLIDSSQQTSSTIIKKSLTLSRASLLSLEDFPIRGQIKSENLPSCSSRWRTIPKEVSGQDRMDLNKKKHLTRLNSAPVNAVEADGMSRLKPAPGDHYQSSICNKSKLIKQTSGPSFCSPGRYVFCWLCANKVISIIFSFIIVDKL